MEHDAKPTSLWKKELSFRRKPAARETDGVTRLAEPASTPDDLRARPASASVWKREVSFRRRAKLVSAPVETELEELQRLSELELALEAIALDALPDVVPELEPVAEPAAEIEHSWLTKPLEEVSEPPWHEEPAPAAVEAPNRLPGLPDLPAEPAGLLEVDAAGSAPLAGAAPKVPFYKRELSLKRRPKERDAVKTPAPRQSRKTAKVPRPKLRRASFPRPSLPAAKGGRTLVGLKIGASQIAAARVVNGDEPELVQVAREPLDAGIVVGGELRDPEALADALIVFFRQHKLPKRGVRLGIANNRIGVRTFEVSGIDDPKQLANAIRFRAQEVLPIPIEETVLDYQILSVSTDANGVLTRRVLLVVAYRELVDRYVHACRKAGIEIVGIDLEAFALLRALAEPQPPAGDERGALVAVSVGHDRSTFAVSDGRNCEFTRVLEWGGWALNVAIARALDLSPSEAEPVKRALSLTGAGEPPEGFDESQLDTAREAARKGLQSFARELVSSLQFYQNQPDSLGIGEIVLTGGTTHLPGFAVELERLIGVPVRVGDPLARVKVSERIRESEQTGSFAIAIGLGIDD